MLLFLTALSPNAHHLSYVVPCSGRKSDLKRKEIQRTATNCWQDPSRCGCDPRMLISIYGFAYHTTVSEPDTCGSSLSGTRLYRIKDIRVVRLNHWNVLYFWLLCSSLLRYTSRKCCTFEVNKRWKLKLIASLNSRSNLVLTEQLLPRKPDDSWIFFYAKNPMIY